jgi:hypothetical protein
LKKVWKKNTVQKILKAENGRIGKNREHDRKEEPKRAPVVPARRGP